MDRVARLMKEVLGATPPDSARGLHVNYRYLLAWARAVAAERPGARILDFGCGGGVVVRAARRSGLEFFYGADAFYEGGDGRREAREAGLLGDAIREIRNGRIDFEDGTFDLVLSNQVFEHVEDLAGALAELSRVLRPDGLLVCLFPTREVVREAHCGIPFLHWFDRKSTLRHRWAVSLGGLGIGFEKEAKDRDVWAREAIDWMDRYVFYRPRRETLRLFRRHFSPASVEEHYLAYRLGQKGRVGGLAPLLRIPFLREGARLICRRFNGIVLVGGRGRK